MGANALGISGRNKSASAQSPDFTGKLYTCLADLDEQAKERYRLIIRQMAENEGVTEDLQCQSQWAWVRAMNSVVNRAVEIINSELINI